MVREMLGMASGEGAAVDHIVYDLASRIIDGRLAPGTVVNSVALAEQYRSSRTPVRAALLTLRQEGLVEILPRHRPRVSPVTLRQVRELYQIRAWLHGLVSELIVRDTDEAGLARLTRQQRLLEEDASRNDQAGYFWHNVAFRHLEAEVSGNQELIRMLASLGLRALQLRHVSLSLAGRLEQSVADHRRLLAAYADRDRDRAVRLTKEIIMAGLHAIETSGWPGLVDEDPTTSG